MRIEAIKKNVKGNLGKEILFFETIGSTNTTALALAGKHGEGLVVISDSQEKGRGRLGRSWISPPSSNIYLSIVLKPEINPGDATLITLSSAVACCLALRSATGLEVRIKWPNDLMISDRKVGGILTELKIAGKRIDYAIVGIGINVNIDPDAFPDEIRGIATSLKRETGKVWSREGIVVSVLNEMQIWYACLKNLERERILSVWKGLTSTLGREVAVTAGHETYQGLAESIDDEGMLLLRLPNGERKRIHAGDLTVLR